jgi:hypothetical protein
MSLIFHSNLSDLFDFRRSSVIGPVYIEDNNKKLITNLKTLMIITIITIGFIGNIINMSVFGKKRMRNNSTFRFLFYLSAADLMVLSTGCLHVLIKNIFQGRE